MTTHIEQSNFHEQLVRGLTHKMNNILSLFHGYLGLLIEDKKLDRATLDGLTRIRQGANEASELMDRAHGLRRDIEECRAEGNEQLLEIFTRQLATCEDRIARMTGEDDEASW